MTIGREVGYGRQPFFDRICHSAKPVEAHPSVTLSHAMLKVSLVFGVFREANDVPAMALV